MCTIYVNATISFIIAIYGMDISVFFLYIFLHFV